MGIENPVHLLFIALVALVVLGPKRLPGLARALGNGIREFREALGQAGASGHEPALVVQASDPTQPASPTEPVHVEPVDPTRPVDPGESVRSPDAPDHRPL